LLSITYGLFAALGWGAADFTGGLASRRVGAYRAVFYGEIFGLVLIVAATILSDERQPGWASLALGAAAGAIGTTGLLMLYHALSIGKMSIATPVSALLAASLPVVYGTFMEGFPGLLTFLGFGLSLAAIWLISREEGNNSRFIAHFADLRLPLLAGIGFGSYFILMHAAADGGTLWPMIASRTGGTLIMIPYMFARRESWHVPRTAWPFIAVNAVLDVGGNAFYLLAIQAGRMDISAVLSSLYPAATVLLAALLLRERVSRSQTVGILLALTAIVFLTI